MPIDIILIYKNTYASENFLYESYASYKKNMPILRVIFNTLMIGDF